MATITHLGITIDSNNMSISIPEDRYNEIMTMLPTWLHKKTCTKKQLLSLIGKLSFVCKVIRPGRTFLRRLIDLSTTVQKLHHHINFTADARADIAWWMEFMPQWNRRSIIPDCFEISNEDFTLFTDASTSGFGAIWGNAWIQDTWHDNTSSWSIDTKELFAIYAAAVTWGDTWAGKRIVFNTDNLPITQAWQSGTSKSKPLMCILRKTFLLAAKKGFSLSLKHIFGIYNSVADALSRFKVRRFRTLQPTADHVATPIPAEVWNI